MNLVELYKKTPVARHSEIIVSGDRVFFDDEEYILRPDGELKLIRSEKKFEQRLAAIEAKLSAKSPAVSLWQRIKTRVGL